MLKRAVGIGARRRDCARRWATSSTANIVVVEDKNGVRTLRMNDPRRLNAWTRPMLTSLFQRMRDAAADDGVRAVLITGADPYYCAGVDLSAMVSKPMWPTELRAKLATENEALFNHFLAFTKPYFVAVNGPAIGAAVTTATLGEGIIASERATFHTPFAALGLVPEGCSSVHFERLMGAANAARMLGAEGWKPTAVEAHEAGLVQRVASHAELLDEAQRMAEAWIAEGRGKVLAGQGLVDEYQQVNARESAALAEAFLARPFFAAQAAMAARKGKRLRALLFQAIGLARPIWGMNL